MNITTLDLRDLATDLRDELGYAVTGCGNCDGSGETDDPCSTCDGTGGPVGSDEVCDDCDGAGNHDAECSECGGDGEVFDLNMADADKIEALVDLAGELGNQSFDATTREGIEAAADELASIGNNYEPTLILESDFTEYAQDLAESIGAMPEGNHWPVYCIDWERAARDLSVDYTTVSYAGNDYLIRSW